MGQFLAETPPASVWLFRRWDGDQDQAVRLVFVPRGFREDAVYPIVEDLSRPSPENLPPLPLVPQGLAQLVFKEAVFMRHQPAVTYGRMPPVPKAEQRTARLGRAAQDSERRIAGRQFRLRDTVGCGSGNQGSRVDQPGRLQPQFFRIPDLQV
jgi:hypothetical protein